MSARKFSLIAPMLLILAGCTIVTGSVSEADVNARTRGANYYFDTGWLQRNEEQLVGLTVEYIRERHPATARDFPGIIIGNVRVPGYDDVGTEARTELEELLGQLMQKSAERLLEGSASDVTWTLAAQVDFVHEEMSPLYPVLGLPIMVVCFKTVFMLCPAGSSTEILVTADVTTAEGNNVTIAGAGIGRQYMSTLVVKDNPDPDFNGDTDELTRALAAAMAGLADAVVTLYEEQRRAE